jgi:hypothetical protein
MVAQLLEKKNIGVRVEKVDALSMGRIFSLNTKNVALVCLCYVENATAAQISYAVRRLRRKTPEAVIVVSLIGASTNYPDSASPSANSFDFVERSLRETVARIVATAKRSGNVEGSRRALLEVDASPSAADQRR